MAGDAQTGVCIMQMEAGLDTGPVLSRHETPIAAGETTGALHDRLSGIGAQAIVSALAQLDDLTPTPQPEDGVTYAHKIDKAEAEIDWSKTATEIDRQIVACHRFRCVDHGGWCACEAFGKPCC
jgi:methionyl-tRNA formyltransferase